MRLWARLMCGWCGNGFTADPDTVPTFPRPPSNRVLPMCKNCWTMRGRMRAAANEAPQDRPKAYPEDYE